MPPDRTRRLTVAAVAAVVVVAAAVRLWHLGHGLPEAPHVDAFKFVHEAGRMLATGEWRPHLLQHPQLYPRLMAAVAVISGARDLLALHLIGRLLSALAGVALVPACYLLGRRMAGPVGGLVAAGLVAVEPGAVTMSRIVAPDAVMVAAATWALVLALSTRARLSSAAGAGLCLGLAVAAKLSALVVAPWVVLGAALASPPPFPRRRRFTRAVVVVIAAVPAAVAASPALVAQAADYAGRFQRELAIQAGGQIGRVQGGWLDLLLSRTPTWEQPWLGTSLAGNLGLLATAVAVVAMAALLAGRAGRAGLVVAGTAATVYLAAAGPGHVKAYRFLLPALPLLAAASGWAVAAVVGRCGRWRGAAVVACAVAVVVVPAWRTARYLDVLMRPTSNAVAATWFSDHVPAGTKVFLSPFFVANLARPDLVVVELPAVGGRQYRLPVGSGPSPEREPIYFPGLVDRLAAGGVQLVVLNSYFDGAFSPLPENLRWFPRSVAEYRAFRRRLAAAAELEWSVGGWSDHRSGPDIEVWRLTTSP